MGQAFMPEIRALLQVLKRPQDLPTVKAMQDVLVEIPFAPNIYPLSVSQQNSQTPFLSTTGSFQ